MCHTLKAKWDLFALVLDRTLTKYLPWVSHSHCVPPHRQIPDQGFRRRLFTLIAVQVQCPIRLRWRETQLIRNKELELRRKERNGGYGKSGSK